MAKELRWLEHNGGGEAHMRAEGSDKPGTGSDSGLFWLVLVFNTFITMGLVLFLPVLVPVVTATRKRRRTFFQRMGWRRPRWRRFPGNTLQPRIWVHALSVGEVMAAHPLVDQILASHRDARLFFTVSTLTGYQTAQQLFGSRDVHIGYFPYDWLWAVRKVADLIDPTLVIVTETDIWPTFLWELKRRKIPVFLVNLRISARTWKYYTRFRWITARIYAQFDGVCVQTDAERQRLSILGYPSQRICITGNLKFDGLSLPDDADVRMPWQNRVGHSLDQPVIVAGSTHDGEEEVLCNSLNSLLAERYDVSLVIAPRDPLRSQSVRALFRQNGFDCDFLSKLDSGAIEHWPRVVVVNSIGRLKSLYRLAYVAFVGGSLVPSGGHNPLEPAFWGKPILFGADMRDFAVIADYLTKGGGAVRVPGGHDLTSILRQLLDDPKRAETMGNCALKILNRHRGAVERTLAGLPMARHQRGSGCGRAVE